MTALATILTAVETDLEALLEDLLELDPLPDGTLSVGGREPPAVTRPGQPVVHVRPGTDRNHAQGGGHQVEGHELEVLVRVKVIREGARTGAGQIEQARPVAEAIRDLFKAGPPSSVSAVEGVIGSHAEMSEADRSPSEAGLLETAVRVSIFTNGDVSEGP